MRSLVIFAAVPMAWLMDPENGKIRAGMSPNTDRKGKVTLDFNLLTIKFSNSVCRYTIKETLPDMTSSEFRGAVSVEDPDSVLPDKMCVNVATVASTDSREYPGRANPLYPGTYFRSLQCKRLGMKDPSITYELLSGSGGAYEVITDAMRNVWNNEAKSSLLTRLSQKLPGSERRRVQAAADRLCGFISARVVPRILGGFETELGGLLRRARDWEQTRT